MGTHQRVLSESSPKNTNRTGFKWFKKLRLCAFDESNLSIGRVKLDMVSSELSDQVFIPHVKGLMLYSRSGSPELGLAWFEISDIGVVSQFW